MFQFTLDLANLVGKVVIGKFSQYQMGGRGGAEFARFAENLCSYDIYHLKRDFIHLLAKERISVKAITLAHSDLTFN